MKYKTIIPMKDHAARRLTASVMSAIRTVTLFFTVVGCLGRQSAVAMVYQPTKVGMGDQWLYYHDGTHYLFHLYEQPAGQLYGVYLATSKDGVHFREVGPVVEKQNDAAWLGSGSVWRAGGKYIMNFSEARAHQSISFAQSEDLVHWKRLGDEYRSNPDPRWYEVDRWDCIWALPRQEGGFWGYLSANPWRRSDQHPSGLTYRSTGMVESDDGVRWRAVAPPVFQWGDTPQMVNAEVGAVAKLKDKYYMLVQTWGPYPGGTYMGNTAPGMYTFVGDSPRGPFRPDTAAFRLLGNTHVRSTHFLRFYSLPDELLVNHFLFTRGLKAWLAPLKKAVVDDQGHLRLHYWKGNDALKGTPIPVEQSSQNAIAPERNDLEKPVGAAPGPWVVDGRGGLAMTPFGNKFNLVDGVVLEGTLEIVPSGETPARCGLYVQEDAKQSTALLMGSDGRTELGRLRLQGKTTFEPEDHVQAGITPRCNHTFRLLTRRYMLEFYLDDRLIQCYSIPERATGQIGMVAERGRGVVRSLNAWNMTLTAGEARHGDAEPKTRSPGGAAQQK